MVLEAQLQHGEHMDLAARSEVLRWSESSNYDGRNVIHIISNRCSTDGYLG